MCQKKRKDVDYKLLKEFFQKYFVVHEQSAVENSFSTQVCYGPDGLFWLNLLGSFARETDFIFLAFFTVVCGLYKMYELNALNYYCIENLVSACQLFSNNFIYII